LNKTVGKQIFERTWGGLLDSLFAYRLGPDLRGRRLNTEKRRAGNCGAAFLVKASTDSTNIQEIYSC
jgi:hypothetical protein